MRYKISIPKPLTHFLQIELVIDRLQLPTVELQLPAWRPGRYELQHYAKYIRSLMAFNRNGDRLPARKLTRDRWQVDTLDAELIVVRYDYYAGQMDAGGSWLDDMQVYINWINCLFLVVGREDEACDVELDIPGHYRLATSLYHENRTLYARNYAELVDAPLIASPALQHRTYQVAGVKFHIWLQGTWQPNWAKLLDDFAAFSEQQRLMFGGFPFTEYHFLLQILPYAHYHGVEHANSTVIVLGPDDQMDTPHLYRELLGISSHELFHAWNVTRIRPSEMLPYDYTQENYFDTGYVAEGFTTYYGDLMLKRAGLLSPNQYLDELNKLLKRYSENYGRQFASLTASSWDLWLDGYSAGIPHRKVSIYVQGALVALALDGLIRQQTKGTKSLDDAMRRLWEEFGQARKGYTHADVVGIIAELAGITTHAFFHAYVEGTTDLRPILSNAAAYAGLEVQTLHAERDIESRFGVKAALEAGVWKVVGIAPGSPAENVLDLKDELLAIDSHRITDNWDALTKGKEEINMTLFRNNRLKECVLQDDDVTYFEKFQLILPGKESDEKPTIANNWLT